jgi:hypothetical protein
MLPRRSQRRPAPRPEMPGTRTVFDVKINSSCVRVRHPLVGVLAQWRSAPGWRAVSPYRPDVARGP